MSAYPLSGHWQTGGLTASFNTGRKRVSSERYITACLTCRGAAIGEKEREAQRIVDVRHAMERNVTRWLAKKGLT